MDLISSSTCFGGQQRRYKHRSTVLKCDMNFSVYLPEKKVKDDGGETIKPPVLYWLSGLTCNDENFVQKAGAQQFASQYGMAIVCPDTSPRGNDVDGQSIPDDENGDWDFGLGAGFYVNATQLPWAEHYQMYDYIAQELPSLVAQHFEVDTSRAGISGHSMGGHGALTIGLKHPELFRSISAFAPISSPMNCPWGKKALSNYLGNNDADWIEYDACELVSALGKKDPRPLFVDQGMTDAFLEEQLKPELLERACKDAGRFLMLRRREHYDHSYFFVASFIEDHIRFHAQQLAQI